MSSEFLADMLYNLLPMFVGIGVVGGVVGFIGLCILAGTWVTEKWKHGWVVVGVTVAALVLLVVDLVITLAQWGYIE